ncbi:MAG: hypothetical protein COA49_04860 [Bacteroidetes bacterium]|nr:MAG: hypothetical protein COA49_04860 [Bacteroidota bacterium]
MFFPVFVLLNFIWVGGSVWGQNEITWQSELQNSDVSVEEVREVFKTKWSDRSAVPRSNGAKPFERWAWWVERRTAPNSNRPPARALWDAFVDEKSNNSRSSSIIGSAWKYAGNDNIPIFGGAGRVNNVVVYDGGWLACAPSGGLWLSTDEGVTWNPAGGGVDALSAVGATDVIVDPLNLNHWYLATGDSDGATTYSIGLLETLDAGVSWQTTGLIMPVDGVGKIFKVEFHPDSSNVIFVASSSGLYRSSDSGVSFNQIKPGVIRDIEFNNFSSNIITIAQENVGVFRSTDFGITWVQVNLPESSSLGRIEIAVGDSNPDIVYVFGAHYFTQTTLGVWRSDDGGASFYPVMLRSNGGPNMHGWTSDGSDYSGQAWWDMCIAVNPLNADNIVIGGVNLWESIDGGVNWICDAHWSGQGAHPLVHADQHGITFLQDGRMIVANDGGVYLRDNNGFYDDKSNGLDIAQIYRLGLNPHEHSEMILGTQDNGTSLYNKDGWQRVLDGDGMGCFYHASDSSKLFMSAYYGLLYRSDNGGRTNLQIANYSGSGVNEFGNWLTPWLPSSINPNVIYVGKKSIHRSDDGGSTWTTLGPMSTTKADAIALSATNPDLIYVAKREELWKSTNGYDFTEIINLPGATIGDVLISSSDPNEIWITFGSYVSGNQVWVSYDAGGTWVDMSLGLPALPVNTIIESSIGTKYVGTDMGVFIYDSSIGWERFGTELPITIITDLEIRTATNRLVAATYGRGVWEVPLLNIPVLDLTAMGFDNFERLQCDWTFDCSPKVLNSGLTSITSLTYKIEWDNSSTTINHTFSQPLEPGSLTILPTSSHVVDSSGTRTISFVITEINSITDPTLLNNTSYESCTVSGLGYRGTLSEWAGCNAIDLKWSLSFGNSTSHILQSKPHAAGDSTSITLCLPAGCLVLQWTDEDGDGWLDAYCAEPGGFEWLSPFGDSIASSQGVDFSLTSSFTNCIDLPWCNGDLNGDGERNVSDLLLVLSEFGCISNCTADLNGDGVVTIVDLMNLLTTFGTSCY